MLLWMGRRYWYKVQIGDHLVSQNCVMLLLQFELNVMLFFTNKTHFVHNVIVIVMIMTAGDIYYYFRTTNKRNEIHVYV
jgi:hypothetical protein